MLCLLHEWVGTNRAKQSSSQQQKYDKRADSETDAVADTDGLTLWKNKNKTISMHPMTERKGPSLDR